MESIKKDILIMSKLLLEEYLKDPLKYMRDRSRAYRGLCETLPSGAVAYLAIPNYPVSFKEDHPSYAEYLNLASEFFEAHDFEEYEDDQLAEYLYEYATGADSFNWFHGDSIYAEERRKWVREVISVIDKFLEESE